MTDIFRDPTEGAMARRLDLLRRRRDELITMPHAVRRVVVARSARIAASLVLCLGGAAMLVAAANPMVNRLLEAVLPGLDPAVLSQLLLAAWVLAVFAYAMARSRAEHRFIVAMSRHVLPSDDLSHDLERLTHEHPDAIAKQLAHRLEVRSAALPVLAAALVLPATLLYIIESARELGWSRTLDATIATQAWALVGSAALGGIAAILVTRRFARVAAVAPLAACVAAVATAAAVITAIYTAAAPPLWSLTPVALSITFAVIARRLRIEREWIDAEDPAAGSKLLTLRDVIAAVRRAYTTVRARIRRRTVIAAAAGAALIATAAATAVFVGARTNQLSFGSFAAAIEAPIAAPPAPRSAQEPVTIDEAPQYRVESIGAGQVRMTVELEPGSPVDIPGLAGLDAVPAEWRARIVVRLAGPTSGPVRATPFVGESKITLSNQTDAIISTIEVCGPHAGRLGLHLEALGDWPPGPHTVSLVVEPQLVLSPCLSAPRP